jgi:hypothetical protein
MMTVAHGFGMLALGFAVILIGGLIIFNIINKREDEDDGRHY